MLRFTSQRISYRRPTWRTYICWIAVLGVVGLIGALLLFATIYTRMPLPDLEQLRTGQRSRLGHATVVYTAEGRELTRFYRENRTWISYDDVAPVVVDALVATEDHRFYAHPGVDVIRLVAATIETIRGHRQGASTIAMQLTRNLFPEVARSTPLRRKLKEIAAAIKMERHYSKNDIIEMYLNTVPFGHQAYGIEAAARTYFNTTAARLDTLEGATLVGMLKGPTHYNPMLHPDRARTRRNVVLMQMRTYGDFPPATLDRLRQAPLALDVHTHSLASELAPHFAAYVRRWLSAWADRTGYDLYTDGLRVHTTLDARLQRLAQQAVAAQVDDLQAVAGAEWSEDPMPSIRDLQDVDRDTSGDRPFQHFWNTHPDVLGQHIRRTARYRRAVQRGASSEDAMDRLHGDAAFLDSLKTALTRLEAGLVALDPHTGHVKAWVGGRNFARDQYDKVALARRQPGSTFKPFVYAAALEGNYTPHDTLRDENTPLRTDGGSTWQPRNAGGAASGDSLSLRDALARSKNTVTAQLITEVGADRVAYLARKMGIESPLRPVPSLALGTSEVTLLELAGAYATLAAGGIHRSPTVVTRIEDRTGQVVTTFEPTVQEALSQHTAYAVVDMLRAAIDEGTGRALRSSFGIDADVAGKTGTTQHGADGWFVLAHPRLVVGSWVGFNDPRITFRSSYWGQGAHNALYVVGDFFKRTLDAKPTWRRTRFPAPYGYDHAAASPTTHDSLRQEADVEQMLRKAVQHQPAATERPASDTSYTSPSTLEPPDGDVERALRHRLTHPPRRPHDSTATPPHDSLRFGHPPWPR